MAILEELTTEELDKRERELLLSFETPVDPNISNLGPAGLDIREQELVESLRGDGVDINEPELELTAEESFRQDQNIRTIAKKHPFFTFHEIMNNTLPLKLDGTVAEAPEGPIGFVETLKEIKLKEK